MTTSDARLIRELVGWTIFFGVGAGIMNARRRSQQADREWEALLPEKRKVPLSRERLRARAERPKLGVFIDDYLWPISGRLLVLGGLFLFVRFLIWAWSNALQSGQ